MRLGGGSGVGQPRANSIVIMDWVWLRDHHGEIERGAVFRLPAQWPYEETVEFMVAEISPGSAGELGLLVTTGYKAGLWVVSLPDEAQVPGRPWALSASWLRDNWTARVYAGSDPEQVRVCASYPPPRDHQIEHHGE